MKRSSSSVQPRSIAILTGRLLMNIGDASRSQWPRLGSWEDCLGQFRGQGLPGFLGEASSQQVVQHTACSACLEIRNWWLLREQHRLHWWGHT